MILSKKPDSFFPVYDLKIPDESYLIINFVFAVLILLIITGSFIYSPDRNSYPVSCIHEKITGEPCISCGLSHSFSLIVRGRLDEAYHWNIYGMRIFFFFVTQLILRVTYSFYYLRKELNHQRLIFVDIAGSVLLFLIVFHPFIIRIITDVF